MLQITFATRPLPRSRFSLQCVQWRGWEDSCHRSARRAPTAGVLCVKSTVFSSITASPEGEPSL